MNSFSFTELNYSILSVATILIKCLKPALKHSSFVERLSRKDFSKLHVFLSNVAYRLEIASSIELHNEKSISLMVDKL